MRARLDEKNKKLLDTQSEFQEITEEITRQINVLRSRLDHLEEYKAELIKTSRQRSMRSSLRENIVSINNLINEICNLFRHTKTLKSPNRAEKNDRKKILQRLRIGFTQEHNRFVKTINTFEHSERVYLELRKSIFSSINSNTSGRNSNLLVDNRPPINIPDSPADPEIIASMEDIDFYQAMLEEREKQVQNIKGIAYELKLAADSQAKAIQANEQDLESMVKDASFAEKMVNTGNKDLEEAASKNKGGKSWKKNLVFCLMILLLCAVVVVIILGTGLVKVN